MKRVLDWYDGLSGSDQGCVLVFGMVVGILLLLAIGVLLVLSRG